MTSGKSIICFSANDWSDIASSKLHIMKYLGKSNTVLYIDTIGIRRPRLNSRDGKRALGKLQRILRGIRRVESNVFVWSPFAIPYHGVLGVDWFNARFIAMMVKRFASKLGMRQPIIWSYLPNAIDIIKRIPATRVIYHCIDDYGAFTDVPKSVFEKMERRMLKQADLTVVSAKRLFELRKPYAKRIVHIPHGVNLAEFQDELRKDVYLPDIDSLRRPIAGFVGRIADWVDLPLIVGCAKALPDWTFVLVGPSNIDLSPYLNIPNMVFLGKKNHEEIPYYIRRFNVCLMPFIKHPLVDSINPLKMYEYLAVGKPVVSVPLVEIEEYSHLITITSPSNFPTAIQIAYREDTEEKQQQRIDSVSRRSWGDIAETILGMVDITNNPSL